MIITIKGKTMKKMVASIVATGFLATAAMAHYTWIEKGCDGAKLYFGEWHIDLYEKKGGRLDSYSADTILPEGVANSKKVNSDHIFVELNHGGDIAWVESIDPRQSRLVERTRWNVNMARAGREDTKALMDLDMVPVSPNSNTFVVYYQGEPLPYAEFELFGPPKWLKEYETDENGKVTIETPWQGQYIVELKHVIDEGGVEAGVEYDYKRYVYSLTFNTQ